MNKEKLEAKLKTFFVVGGGAWQKLWEPEEKQSAMGFNPCSDTAEEVEITHKKLQSSIQPELLRRFRAEVLIMNPLTKDDYKNLICEFSTKVPIDVKSGFEKLAHEKIEYAIESNLGMRFFEEILTDALTQLYTQKQLEKNAHNTIQF